MENCENPAVFHAHIPLQSLLNWATGAELEAIFTCHKKQQAPSMNQENQALPGTGAVDLPSTRCIGIIRASLNGLLS